jgi:hypothetical protein
VKLARIIFSLILCATGSVAFAQQPPKQHCLTSGTPAAGEYKCASDDSAKAVAKPEPPAPLPQLSKEESLTLENLQLKFSLLQNQQSQLQSQYQGFVQRLNAEHSGFTFDVQTGQFVAAPKPPAEKK